MIRLKRQPDGSYSCTYGPHQITVRKEMVERAGPYGRDHEVWVARCGAHVWRASYIDNTRMATVSMLCVTLDMPKPEDLLQIRAAMIAAHPDKGGSHEAFIRARKAYEEAKEGPLSGMLARVQQ